MISAKQVQQILSLCKKMKSINQGSNSFKRKKALHLIVCLRCWESICKDAQRYFKNIFGISFRSRVLSCWRSFVQSSRITLFKITTLNYKTSKESIFNYVFEIGCLFKLLYDDSTFLFSAICMQYFL